MSSDDLAAQRDKIERQILELERSLGPESISYDLLSSDGSSGELVVLDHKQIGYAMLLFSLNNDNYLTWSFFHNLSDDDSEDNDASGSALVRNLLKHVVTL